MDAVHVMNFDPVRHTFGESGSHEESFARDGFVQLGPCLTTRALAFIRARVDEVLAAKHPSIENEWVLGLHDQLPPGNWMWRLASHRKILDVVQAQIGGNVELYATQIADKPPGGGSCIPWHQVGSWVLLRNDIRGRAAGRRVAEHLLAQAYVCMPNSVWLLQGGSHHTTPLPHCPMDASFCLPAAQWTPHLVDCSGRGRVGVHAVGRAGCRGQEQRGPAGQAGVA